ncbi:MAG: hypothetical protein ACFCD0_08565 [Gemmataceae bacterium]
MFASVLKSGGICALMLVLVGLNPSSQAGQNDSPKVILAKVTKAYGGVNKLKRYQGYEASGKGVFYGMGNPIKYQGQWKGEGARSRMSITMQFGDQTIQLVEVVGNKTGWTKLTGLGVKEMTKVEFKEKFESNYVGGLVPRILVESKGFEFNSAGSIQVKGKDAIGLQVLKKGRPDATLYFDPKTALLVKTERPGVDPKGGNEFTEEVYYSNYKEFNGIPVATKIQVDHDGKLFVKAEFSNFQVTQSLDKKTFERP